MLILIRSVLGTERRLSRRADVRTPGGRTNTTATHNHLLDALSPDARAAVEAALEPVTLPVRTPIHEAGARIEHVYFPAGAMISVVTVLRDGTQIEVITVGREGMTGAQGLLDQSGFATQMAWCQITGDAYRTSFATLLALCERFPELRGVVERYLSAQLDVMAQSIACNRLHYVNERCARWLLMVHDRVGRDEFPLTHEIMATMLGVRRAGVSTAAATLQQAGFISYARGRFRIVDREGLESASCECYSSIVEAFKRRQLAPA